MRMRKFTADTLAMIVFSTVVGMSIEILVSGLTLVQSIQARLTAAPVNVLTARPYGFFRDWMFKKTGAGTANQIKKAFVDVACFVVFQMPLYVGILYFAGATWKQIAAAGGSASILTAFMGRPYGLFLDFFRRLFGVPQT